MNIKEYAVPATLEEAYELLTAKKSNRLIGGTTFLSQTKAKISTAIDLSDCGLDYIKDEPECVRIGAYTTFREIETSPVIKEYFGSMFSDVLEHLIGVQLRNMITIGGHVASRFGFSDVIPVLMSLDARVVFYKDGEMPLADYMLLDKKKRDILTEVVIPKEGRQGMVQMTRRAYSDYSIFCLAVTKDPANDWRIAVGVRPGNARMAYATMARIRGLEIPAADTAAYADGVVSEMSFGNNLRGSAEYRRMLCRAFAKRAFEELSK